MNRLRFRQVHLDFHTSPDIPDIGAKFDKKHWQETLLKAHVNSITCFAVCHHGLAYYDTELGNKHPGLKFDLLRQQFDACKEVGINVPIYLTAGVNNFAAEAHPEWRSIDYKGSFAGWTISPLQPGFKTMCFNTAYLEYLCAQIREVVRMFPDCDGIFTDIVGQNECCCQTCMDSMLKLGFNPELSEDRAAHARLVLENYYRESTKAAKSLRADMPIFHNSGHLIKGDYDLYKYFDHFELESLPTGGWGYDHFPSSAKYCTQLGKEFLGMTGKFHSTWGEFGGYKHPDALRYECAAMISIGAKCSIGDQLHPNGRLDTSTYKLIGTAYREVEQKEEWSVDVENVADVGLLSSTAVNRRKGHLNDDPADTGAVRALLESHVLFDIIDERMVFNKYKALILPDNIAIGPELKIKIEQFLQNGGRMLLSGDSGLDAEKNAFLFDIGADYEGKSEFEPDYLLPAELVQPDFVASPMVMYMASNRIKVTAGQSLGDIYDPYFNRTYKHFCSHQHTPYRDEPSGYDCGVQNGNIIYIAHPVFSIYMGYGAAAYRQYISNIFDILLDQEKTIETNLHSVSRVNVMKQAKKQRYIVHLLHADKINRGSEIEMSGGNINSSAKSVEVIEEIVPVFNTEVELNFKEDISAITIEPGGTQIPFDKDGSRCRLKIPEFSCHIMLVCKYE